MSSDRLLLTLGTVVPVGLLWLLMLWGWRGRQRRQGDLPAPAPAPAAGDVVLDATAGLFVGTTYAENWLDRVAVHDLGHRSAGWILLDTHGVHVEREGLDDLYLPYDAIEGASLGDALAGKFVGRQGLVLIDWRLGNRLLTSGFRADDHDAHLRIVDAVNQHLTRSAPSEGKA